MNYTCRTSQPIALTDSRRWHWGNPAPEESSRREVAALVAVAALFLIRIQVAGIYLHACLGKLGVAEWRDGTALYYWLNSPMFGAPGWLRWPLGHLLSLGPVVAGLTWGTLALEFSLAIGLFMPKRRWCSICNHASSRSWCRSYSTAPSHAPVSE